MQILFSPITRRALLSIAALLLIHPLTFSQESVSNHPFERPVALEDAPVQTASLSADSESGWPSLRSAAEPVPAAPVIAVERIQLPKSDSHPFWDRHNRTLFIAVGGLAATDFYITHSNLANGGKELNPVTRVFAGSTAGLATNFVLETGGVIGISYLFHRSGHHKLERLTSYLNIGSSTEAVVYSFSHR
jgi:hypothetical protein